MADGYGETAAYGYLPYKGEDVGGYLAMLFPDQVAELSASRDNPGTEVRRYV